MKIKIHLLVVSILLSSCAEQLDPCSEEIGFEEVKVNLLSQLKAPSTATFASFEDSYVVVRVDNENVCEIMVMSHVDAENSYGAKLRNKFSGFATYSYKKKSWSVKASLW